MIVFDIARRSTFTSVPRWCAALRECTKTVVLVGNKGDDWRADRERVSRTQSLAKIMSWWLHSPFAAADADRASRRGRAAGASARRLCLR